jgi:nucleotide-binding universal stress UspA family protein
MSGEETLAQVYREVEAPKMKNFKKAAFIVFVYSMVLTAGISFLAVLMIPDDVRMKVYSENLISGLAMHVLGPKWAQLTLQAFVVLVGFLILSGAVNTAIIGSNGVLNRVSEDGVMPDWFLKPHPKYGTSYRILTLVVGLQLFTILASRGDTLILGEAYAFGVVWSFVFKALAMVVLRFKDRTPREYKVPLNLRLGKLEIPCGLILIFLVLLVSAVMNLLTKQVATTWGLGFTVGFLLIFVISEKTHERRRQGARHLHQEQFNQDKTAEINPARLGIKHPYRKLVAIRSPQNLFMLEQALSEADPQTTDVVVMTSKLEAYGVSDTSGDELDPYDRALMTAVVTKAETIGKHVIPLIVPTNNPFYAVLRTAREIGAQEVVIGASNKFTAEEQLDQISLYWIELCHGRAVPLTVRILSRSRDVAFDLEGGNRIPKITERRARTAAELRGAGVGIDRVLFAYDATAAGSDRLQGVLTMLDPQVVLNLFLTVPADQANGALTQDLDRAKRIGRTIEVATPDQTAGQTAAGLLEVARRDAYNLIIIGPAREQPQGDASEQPGCDWDQTSIDLVQRRAHCPVCFLTLPALPGELEA